MELDRSRREVNGCNETEIVSTVEKWRNRKTFNIYFFFGDRNRGRCALFTEILISIGQQNVSVPCGFSIGQCFRYDSELICDGLHICRFDLCIAEELKAHWEKLERERRQNEALASKLADMEAMASRRETDISELKRTLQLVKEEHQQVMQVTTKRPFLRGLGWIGNSRRPSDESRSTCHRWTDYPFFVRWWWRNRGRMCGRGVDSVTGPFPSLSPWSSISLYRWPSTNTIPSKASTWPWRIPCCSCATRSNLGVRVRVAAGSSPSSKTGRRRRRWFRPLDSARHPTVRHPSRPFRVDNAGGPSPFRLRLTNSLLSIRSKHGAAVGVVGGGGQRRAQRVVLAGNWDVGSGRFASRERRHWPQQETNIRVIRHHQQTKKSIKKKNRNCHVREHKETETQQIFSSFSFVQTIDSHTRKMIGNFLFW